MKGKTRILLIGMSLTLAMSALTPALAEEVPGGSGVKSGVTGLSLTRQDSNDLSWPKVTKEDFPFYLGDAESGFDMPLYFINGVNDVPYIELSDMGDLLVTLYQSWDGDENYGLDIEKDGNAVLLERENGYQVLFDFDENAIYFDDYDAFLHDSGESALLDSVSANSISDTEDYKLFNRLDRGSYDRYGAPLTLNLADYEIYLYHDEDGYYLPLQTVGDFFISLPMLVNTLFNGEAVFLATDNEIGNAYEGYTELGELYYSDEYADRSKDLAHFSYCELCLALDCLYGQKEIHEISSFDEFFDVTGYRPYLLDTDPAEADLALEEFINYYLDDLHSTFNGYSYLCGQYETNENLGLANSRFDDLAYMYADYRTELLGEEILPYEEVGNTAFITFDEFNCDSPSAYYENLDDLDISEDTIALIIYAHEQITRKDSPIENVVIDLSCNTGGALDAAVFLIAWCLGQADLTIKDTLTGAVSTAVYEVDTDLNEIFDLSDQISDKYLYCLISPVSFSCGNLVPTAFKSSHLVTLLGRTTGGGSCMVLPMSTAYGSMFQISAPLRLSTYKNGSSYDIDRGVEPDYTLNDPASYYDRELLADYINNLI